MRNSKLEHFYRYFFNTLMTFFAAILCLVVPQSAHATISFLAPNEHWPAQLRPILALAESGTYVTVGTERGFIAAGLSDKITRVVIVDDDSAVIKYDLINVALTRAAKDRPDYSRLRLSRSFADWMAAAATLPAANKNRALLQDKSMWQFWQLNVLANPDFNIFHHTANADETALDFYKGANYIFLDKNFARVKRLVDNDQIIVEAENLQNPYLSVLLNDVVIAQNNIISVLDISNAWWPKYLAEAGLIEMLKNLKSVVNKKTLLVATELELAHGLFDFQYMGFRYRDILKVGVEKFAKRMLLQHEATTTVTKLAYFETSAQGVPINEIAEPSWLNNLCQYIVSTFTPKNQSPSSLSGANFTAAKE